MKLCGVYRITNKINGKVYVGKSKNIESRFRGHRHDLNKNKHKNKHLQSAWNKYGASAFEFSIVEECEKGSQDAAEQAHLDIASQSPHRYYNKHYKTEGGRKKKQIPAQIEQDLYEYWRIHNHEKTCDYAKEKYGYSHKIMRRIIKEFKQRDGLTKRTNAFILSDEKMNELLEYWLKYSSKKTRKFIRNKYGRGDYVAARLIREFKQMTDKRPTCSNSHYHTSKP